VKKVIYEIARVAVLLCPTLLLAQLFSLFHGAKWGIPPFLLEASLLIFPIAIVALFFTMPTNNTFHKYMRWIIGLSVVAAIAVNVWIDHKFPLPLFPSPGQDAYLSPGSGDDGIIVMLVYAVFDGIALLVLLVEAIVLTAADLFFWSKNHW
jgi:hypothetical protein